MADTIPTSIDITSRIAIILQTIPIYPLPPIKYYYYYYCITSLKQSFVNTKAFQKTDI